MARIRSIDLLRGVDVLLMLFVNEVAGVAGAPSFLRHKGPTDDGMTITDLVFPGVPLRRRHGDTVRARRAAAPRRDPAPGPAPRRHALRGARRGRRADGERGARRRGMAVGARVERADDAGRAPGVGHAATTVGAGAVSSGCGPPAGCCCSSWRWPIAAPTSPAGCSCGPTGGGSSGSSAGRTWVSPACTFSSATARRSSRGSSRSTAAWRSPTRPAASAGPPSRGRSSGASSARTARVVLAGALLGVAAQPSAARRDLPVALRARVARLRGGARRRGAAAPHARGRRPRLHDQQDPRDAAVGPALGGAHVRRLGGRVPDRRRLRALALAALGRDRRREPAARLPAGAAAAVALRPERRPSSVAPMRTRRSAPRPLSASSARPSSPGWWCA